MSISLFEKAYKVFVGFRQRNGKFLEIYSIFSMSNIHDLKTIFAMDFSVSIRQSNSIDNPSGLSIVGSIGEYVMKIPG